MTERKDRDRPVETEASTQSIKNDDTFTRKLSDSIPSRRTHRKDEEEPRRTRGEKRKRRRHRYESSSGCSSIESDTRHRMRKIKDKKRKKHRKRASKRRRHSEIDSDDSSGGNNHSRRKKKRQGDKDKMTAESVERNNNGNNVECADETWESSGCSGRPDNPVHTAHQHKLKAEVAKIDRRMVPMTREEYEAEQSKIREVYDPDTARIRLVRGSGEIIERIVSRESHKQINQQATRGDGASFSRMIHKATLFNEPRR